ncbi:MAG: phage portal protein [Pseudomonadota bacterium]
MWPFKKKEPMEKRALNAGYTNQVISARAEYVIGRRNVAALTSAVQSCVSLWENGLSLAAVDGTDALTPPILALMGRALALRGECVFLLDDDGLIPATDWTISTRNTRPIAYRLSMPDAGGGRSITALAGEVLHVRLGSDVSQPYAGTAPLQRAQLSAELIAAIETAMRDVAQNTPFGSQIISFPETPTVDKNTLASQFVGKRGSILLQESTRVISSGGPMPDADWTPKSLTPDLQKAALVESLALARNAICSVFGVNPGLLAADVAGPAMRESQRHLAQFTLTPICGLIAHEASEKLGASVSLDVIKPLGACDTGGRARALGGVIQALALAREAGLSTEEIEAAKAFAGAP